MYSLKVKEENLHILRLASSPKEKALIAKILTERAGPWEGTIF